MNKLPIQKRAQILGLLVEGTSLRATSRLADCSINTVTKLLIDAGKACAAYQDKALRNLPCKRIQVDEIWSFVYAKARNVADAKAAPEEAGDIWTWTAICADTKLVPSWLVGGRDAGYAHEFMTDLAARLANRVQLTSDGHRAYLSAVADAFGSAIDYATLEKIYGQPVDGQKRYSPPECIGTVRRQIIGNPDPAHVNTSYVERQNLTMRMSMRRFTRLTNGFSKKLENHIAAVSLHYMYYNFCRIHQTLKVTPAMEAGASDHVWSIEEMVALLEAEEKRAAA
jgi:IS1 family transposase